jgi:hypothetical protein
MLRNPQQSIEQLQGVLQRLERASALLRQRSMAQCPSNEVTIYDTVKEKKHANK